MPVFLTLLGVFGDENGCGAQGLSLFGLNSGLTVLSTSSCLGIGHTENVISLYASVEAAVSWDGSTELLSLVGGLLNSVEHLECIFI